MYTQAMDLPGQPEGQTPADAGTTHATLAARFEATIDADGRIEPQDWMPDN